MFFIKNIAPRDVGFDQVLTSFDQVLTSFDQADWMTTDSKPLFLRFHGEYSQLFDYVPDIA